MGKGWGRGCLAAKEEEENYYLSLPPNFIIDLIGLLMNAPELILKLRPLCFRDN